MASLSRTYTDTSSDLLAIAPLTQFGGSLQQSSATQYEQSTRIGSHMPIDTTMHWDWSNPLNILPIMMVLLVVFAVVALVLA